MAGDTYFSSVSLLLHMDGADGSTTFTDSSSNALTVTPNGGAQIKTAQSKFGGASGYFDGTDDYLSIADGHIPEFSNLSFTFETWIYTTSLTNYQTIFSKWVDSNFNRSFLFYILSNGEVALNVNNNFFLQTNTTISTNTWTHVAVTRNSNTWKIWINGVDSASNTSSASILNYATPWEIGRRNDSGGIWFFKGYIDDFRVTNGVARYTSTFTPPTSAFPDFADVLAYSSAAGPLGTPSVQGLIEPRALVLDSGPLGQPQFLAQQWAAISSAPSMLGDLQAVANQWAAIASAPSMLGDVAALGWQLFAHASAPSMLGAASPLAVHDFTGQLGDATTYYVMDLITPDGAVRAPISSWQATLQLGRANYAQCVIPAVFPYVDSINAATEFVIYRRVVLPGDVVIEYEMTRAPVQTVSLDQGPSRYTATISGYFTGFAPDEEGDYLYERTAENIRSLSVSGSGTRIRCSVDWLLRPNYRVFAGERNFIVSYINYYVSGNDAYMDVGERA